MGSENLSLIGRLKRAVKKIKFLLNYSLIRWKLAAMIGAPSGNRRLSFNDRPGLGACVDDPKTDDPGPSRALHKTMSSCSSSSSEDDIDKRAEQFIANFYRQLQLERQISLELRYARGSSFGSSSLSSISP